MLGAGAGLRRRAAGRGPVGPARQRDRAAVPRISQAADQGRRARPQERQGRRCSTIPRSTPSSPPGRPSISTPACWSRPTTSTSCRASSRTSSATSPAATRSASSEGAKQATGITHPDPGPWRAGDRRRRRRCRHGHHDGRPAGRDGQLPRLHAAPRKARADLAGANYLSKAGISGKGSLEFFKKLQNQEYRLAIYAKDSYDRTHPLSSERIQALSRSTRRTRPGTARPIRRSKRASSGSRPS